MSTRFWDTETQRIALQQQEIQQLISQIELLKAFRSRKLYLKQQIDCDVVHLQRKQFELRQEIKGYSDQIVALSYACHEKSLKSRL
jgi:hypothetical protein